MDLRHATSREPPTMSGVLVTASAYEPSEALAL
jgi:hypothetical protein